MGTFFSEITRFEVVALVTNSVAAKMIDQLPEGSMKPRVVADHGSANIADYTRKNIEVQGLDLWLSEIGGPTGNARTERVMGTLKREEINLQEQYENESEARKRIGSAIWIITSEDRTLGTEALHRTLCTYKGE